MLSFIKKNIYDFTIILCDKGIIVNSYKLPFPSSHFFFSTMQTKEIYISFLLPN